MSQARQSQNGVMTTILNTMASRESDYKSSLMTNQDLLKSTADRMAIGGALEGNLLTMIKGGPDEDDIVPEADIQSFLGEQRQRIKNLAAANAKREHKINNFIGAIKQLRNKVATDGAEDTDQGDAKYESIIVELMKQEAGNNPLEAEASEMYMDICDKLGEEVKRGGDDDIEVVRNNNETETTYKCPLTAQLMEDPVKNKVCGHVYSRDGIHSYLNSRKHKYPCVYPGCTNQRVTQDQLEDDNFTATKVKRYIRAMNAKKEQTAMSQAQDFDSDEEE